VKNDPLGLLLLDVKDRGSVAIEKRKILYMLGRKNESASVWRDLLDAWEELGYERKALYGFEHNGIITLTISEVDSIQEDWAE